MSKKQDIHKACREEILLLHKEIDNLEILIHEREREIDGLNREIDLFIKNEKTT